MRISNLRKQISRKAHIELENKKLHIINPNVDFSDLLMPNRALFVNDNTTISESACVVAFINVLYNFLNNILTENVSTTQIKLKIYYLIYETANEDLLKVMRSVPVNIFFASFLQNEYDNLIGLELSNDFKNTYYNLLSANKKTTEFTLRFKDSQGVLFAETIPQIGFDMEDKSTFELRLPINDTTVTEKTGFNSNEQIYSFYYNTYYQKEYPIKMGVLSDNLVANINIIAASPQILEEYNKDFNPLYYEYNK